MNKRGIELVKKFEGCKLDAYKCPAGVWTIGYGHTRGVKEGMSITAEVAEMLLVEDLRYFEQGVRNLTEGLQLSDNQKAALVSFSYNVGLGSLSGSTLLKKIRSDKGDPAIRNEFLRWVRSGGKVLEGLRRRRAAEADLYFEK